MWNENKLINFLHEVNTLLDFYESVSVSLEKFRDEFAPQSVASPLSFRAMCRRKLKELIKKHRLNLCVFLRNNNVIFKKEVI